MKPFEAELSMNEKRLVELVYRHGKIARVDLTKTTGLKGASITRLVSGLTEMGLLTEVVDKSGTRGQPRKLLSLQKSRFRSVGVYIYFNKIVGVLVDMSGQVYDTISREFELAAASDLAHLARELTENLCTPKNMGGAQFLGTGLSIPGNFGTYSKRVRAHELFSVLEGGAIYKEVLNICEWPVFFENDGTASALGEYLFNDRKNADPLFLLHIGYGLGGGAVVNGRPFRGANGNACLPGSLFPYDGPRPTLQDLILTLENAGLIYDDLNFEKSETLEIASVADWIERASTQLRFAAQVVSGMFDPNVIILGGALPMPLIEIIAKNLQKIPPHGPSRGINAAPVQPTSLGSYSGPIGAASLPFFETLFPGSSVERGNKYLDGRTMNRSG
ncbi:ROK family protein [Maritalea sp.]|uniref:ROK family transcriptional regulator n=1 Tax=Maritalea sp. TaxID=2003361 RepID=UPI003EFA7DA5